MEPSGNGRFHKSSMRYNEDTTQQSWRLMRKLILGLTLLEMLIAVAIIGILLAMAIPGFRSIIQNNKAVALSTQWVSALNYAKLEAIRRGQFISICPANGNNFTGCGNAGQWTDGWIVFLDPDGDGVLLSASDRLSLQQTLPEGSSFTASMSVVTFSPTGFVVQGSGDVTLLANGCQGPHGRVVSLTDVGRIAVSTVNCS